MKAMVLNKTIDLAKNSTPLQLVEIPIPTPKSNEVLLKISTCGVCHTELDEIEGRTPPSYYPITLGHQIVGTIEKTVKGSNNFKVGDRVGVAWIFSACGKCEFCLAGNENLCDDFQATGRDKNGGYAEYVVVREDFIYSIPDVFTDVEAAPLLCAGAIGYRSIKLTGLQDGQNLGLTGFGASAHLVLKMVKFKYPNTKVYVFARSTSEQKFALELGANWAGDTSIPSPEKLDCIIDTTPVWKPIIEALKNLKKGGRLIINAIRKEENDKSELLNISYEEQLWQEKEIKSVANVTRSDVNEFLLLAAQIPIKPKVQEFKLEDANKALLEMKKQKIRGAKVLRIN